MRFTKEKLSSLYEVPMEGDALAEQQVDIHFCFVHDFLVALILFGGDRPKPKKGNSVFQPFSFQVQALSFREGTKILIRSHHQQKNASNLFVPGSGHTSRGRCHAAARQRG